jgi:hypothetical protein
MTMSAFAELRYEGEPTYENINQSIATPAAPMAAVASHPPTRNRIEMTNLPMIVGLTAMNMIVGLTAMNMISPMIGMGTTPLITPFQ